MFTHHNYINLALRRHGQGQDSWIHSAIEISNHEAEKQGLACLFCRSEKGLPRTSIVGGYVLCERHEENQGMMDELIEIAIVRSTEADDG